MINQVHNSDYGRHTRELSYELICDQCGKEGVRQGTFKECVAYKKENGWKSKSIRTKDGKYLWSDFCLRCKKA